MTCRLMIHPAGGCPYIKTASANNLKHKYIHITLYYINNIARAPIPEANTPPSVRKIQKSPPAKNGHFLRKSVRKSHPLSFKIPSTPPYIPPLTIEDNIIFTSIFTKTVKMFRSLNILYVTQIYIYIVPANNDTP